MIFLTSLHTLHDFATKSTIFDDLLFFLMMNTVVWSRMLRLTGDWLSRCLGILLLISIWIFFWSLDLGKGSFSPSNSSLSLKTVNLLGLGGTLLIVMRMACKSAVDGLGGDGEFDLARDLWCFGLGDRRRSCREFDLIFAKIEVFTTICFDLLSLATVSPGGRLENPSKISYFPATLFKMVF